jgi:hypothetical protein
MRAVIKLALVGLVTFAIAFFVKHAFFSDVMPVSRRRSDVKRAGSNKNPGKPVRV